MNSSDDAAASSEADGSSGAASNQTDGSSAALKKTDASSAASGEVLISIREAEIGSRRHRPGGPPDYAN